MVRSIDQQGPVVAYPTVPWVIEKANTDFRQRRATMPQNVTSCLRSADRSLHMLLNCTVYGIEYSYYDGRTI